MKECKRCNSVNAKNKCGKCLEVFYCSKDCQVEDWKSHRELCGKSNEDIVQERRTASSVSYSSLESVTSLMKGMMTSLNSSRSSEVLELMAVYERAPDLAAEFSDYMRENSIHDIPKEIALEMLKQETANSKALFVPEMLFYEENESGLHPMMEDPSTVFKLINSSDEKKIDWFFTAPPLDVYVSRDMPPKYDKVYHSFSNSVTNIEPFAPGQTLVAIGFVDLSILLHGSFVEEDIAKPFSFIGYEACVFNVAKTLVIKYMLKKDNAHTVDAILQVWYSSCWSQATLECFQSSLGEAIKNCSDKDVLEILKFWQESEPPSIVAARKEWLNKIDSSSLGPAINCTTSSRNSLTFYFLTGQLLEASVGSVAMFQLPGNWKSKRSRNESVFHSLSQKDLAAYARKNSGDFVKGAISILREAIGKLNFRVRTDKVIISIKSPTFISIDNTKVVKEISLVKPDWISWNNCLDYMTIADFHHLARSCSGPSNTIHLGYSMNWLTNLSQNSCLRMSVGEHMKEYMNGARLIVGILYSMRKLSGMMVEPPIDNPINIMDHFIHVQSYHVWVNFFFQSVPQTLKIDPSEYSVFHRTSCVLKMAWTYDESLETRVYNLD